MYLKQTSYYLSLALPLLRDLVLAYTHMAQISRRKKTETNPPKSFRLSQCLADLGDKKARVSLRKSNKRLATSGFSQVESFPHGGTSDWSCPVPEISFHMGASRVFFLRKPLLQPKQKKTKKMPMSNKKFQQKKRGIKFFL